MVGRPAVVGVYLQEAAQEMDKGLALMQNCRVGKLRLVAVASEDTWRKKKEPIACHCTANGNTAAGHSLNTFLALAVSEGHIQRNVHQVVQLPYPEVQYLSDALVCALSLMAILPACSSAGGKQEHYQGGRPRHFTLAEQPAPTKKKAEKDAFTLIHGTFHFLWQTTRRASTYPSKAAMW
jgi:hypothetical protein